MQKWLLLSILGLSFALVAVPAWAQDYGMAGCGLGAEVFRNQNDKVSQILAATTNGTLGTQTFGITSGTSECTTSGTVKAERAQEAFAEVNFESLSQEMAKGQGEHLTAFAYLFGCSAESMSNFGRLTQQNYSRIFTSDTITPIALVNAVKQNIASDPVLSRTCQG